jgi:hypothetical protein
LLGTVEATDERAAIEKAGKEFKQELGEANRAVRRR